MREKSHSSLTSCTNPAPDKLLKWETENGTICYVSRRHESPFWGRGQGQLNKEVRGVLHLRPGKNGAQKADGWSDQWGMTADGRRQELPQLGVTGKVLVLG